MGDGIHSAKEARRIRSRLRLESAGRQISGLVDDFDLNESFFSSIGSVPDSSAPDRQVNDLLRLAEAETFDDTSSHKRIENEEESGVKLVPLSMKEDIKAGLIDRYGAIRRRGDREESRSRLIEPPKPGMSKRNHWRGQRGKRGMASFTDVDSSDEESGDSSDEDQQSDPWIQSIDEMGDHVSSVQKDTTSSPGSLVVDQTTIDSKEIALSKLLEIMNEREDETVLQCIKRLCQHSSKSNTQSKTATNKRKPPPYVYEDQEGEKPPPHKKSRVGSLESIESPHTHSSNPIPLNQPSSKFNDCVLLADYLLHQGVSAIYQMTPVQLRQLHSPPDHSQKMWEYKWSSQSTEIYGPYPTETMKNWKSVFSQYPDVLVRSLHPLDDGAWQPYLQINWS